MTHRGPDTLEGISWTAVSFYMYKEMFLLYLEKHTVATYFLFSVSHVRQFALPTSLMSTSHVTLSHRKACLFKQACNCSCVPQWCCQD